MRNSRKEGRKGQGEEREGGGRRKRREGGYEGERNKHCWSPTCTNVLHTHIPAGAVMLSLSQCDTNVLGSRLY